MTRRKKPDRMALDMAIRVAYECQSLDRAEVGAYMRLLTRWGWLFERRLLAMQAEQRGKAAASESAG